MATVANLAIRITALTGDFDKAIKNVETQWARSGKRLQSVGADLTKGLTLPILAIGGSAVKAAMDFETSFSGVRKTVSATEPELAKLAQQMRDLAKTKPIDVNELNKIAEMAGQLGVGKNDIAKFTSVVADLAVATNLTADQAGNAMARIANVMQMPLSQVDQMGSAIYALGNFGAATEQEMLDFAQRIAGAGKIAGLSVANILSIGNAFASVGVEAEAGGTAVQKALIAMTTAAQTGKHLQEFGAISGLGAAGFKTTFQKDPAEAFTRFIEGLGKAGQGGIQLLQSVGFDDQRQVRAFLSIAGAQDLLRQNIDKGNESFAQSGILAEAAAKRYGTFANQVQLLWNNLKDAAITVGMSLLPALKDMSKTLEDVLKDVAGVAQWFASLSPETRKLAIEIGLLGVALGPVLYAFGTIMRGGSALVGVFRTLAGAISAASKALQLSPFVGGMTGAAIIGGGIALAKTSAPAYEDAIKSGVMIDPSTGMVIPLPGGGTAPAKFNQSAFDAASAAAEKMKLLATTPGAPANTSTPPVISAAAEAMNKWNEEVSKFKAEFAGVDTINNANAMTEAINKMGGLSKLTTTQLEHYEKAVAEAVEIMRAQGVEIPRTWQAIAASVEATNKALETTKALGEQLEKLKLESTPVLLPTGAQPDLSKATPGAPGTTVGVWANTVKAAGTAASRMATEFREKFAQAFENIPDLITRSLLHSGGFINGLKAIGFQMADALIEPFIQEIIRKLALAKLGEKIARAVFGNSGKGGGGSNPFALAGQLAGGFFLGGNGGGGGNNGGIFSLGGSLLGGLFHHGAATAGTVPLGTGIHEAAVAAAGGGGGFGGALGGLLTNPITGIAAAAALGGFALFRHFTRGSRANDNRDQFLAQFAPFDTKRDEHNPPGFYGLDALLSKYGKHDLFTSLIGAHDPGGVKSAEQSIAGFLQMKGRSVHVYHSGGMVPGTGNVPAILQGGERVLSRDEAANYSGGDVHVHIHAVDAASFDRLWQRQIIPRLHMELMTNQHGTIGRLERSMR